MTCFSMVSELWSELFGIIGETLVCNVYCILTEDFHDDHHITIYVQIKLASLVSETFMHINVYQGHTIVETINQKELACPNGSIVCPDLSHRQNFKLKG